MVKITKVYTRTGDDGTTRLVAGVPILKSAQRVAAYGEIDELNSTLGWARTHCEEQGFHDLGDQVRIVQNELFDLGAELATEGEVPAGFTVTKDQVTRLEHWIDVHTRALPELRSFVLSGGCEGNARFHIARCVCRRAERCMVRLRESAVVRPVLLQYVNRLSDWLFVIAREISRREGKAEYLWEPGSTRATVTAQGNTEQSE